MYSSSRDFRFAGSSVLGTTEAHVEDNGNTAPTVANYTAANLANVNAAIDAVAAAMMGHVSSETGLMMPIPGRCRSTTTGLKGFPIFGYCFVHDRAYFIKYCLIRGLLIYII